MDADEKQPLKQLLVLSGGVAVCPVLFGASITYTHFSSVLAILAVLGSFPLAILSFVGIWWTAWFYPMEKTDAWWWLSVPDSVDFPLSVLIFRMKRVSGETSIAARTSTAAR